MNTTLQFLYNALGRIELVREKRPRKMLAFAPFFDPISLFSPNENTISNIISFFLDPNQTHGQGDVFLKDFCEHNCNDLNLYQPHDNKVIVSNQFWTDKGRPIDFVVQIGNNYIGFENKVWDAPDQPNQVNDYLEDLNKKANQSNGKYLLFYLSPHGDAPSDLSWGQSKNDPHLRVLSFSSFGEDGIIPMFDRWLDLAVAPHVRSFLETIVFFFNKHFGETVMSDEIEAIKPVIKNPAIFSVIPAIYQSYISIKKDFLNAFSGFLKRNENFEVLNGDIDNFISRRKNLQYLKNTNGCKIVFEIDPECIRIGIIEFPSILKDEIDAFWEQNEYKKSGTNEFWKGGFSVISQSRKLDDYVKDYLKYTNEEIESLFYFFRNELFKVELDAYDKLHESIVFLSKSKGNV